MRRRYLLGVLAVLLLIVAVWLVPMALAAVGGSQSPQASPDQAQTAPSGTQCPFLQAHPWLDPHGDGGGPNGATGTTQEIDYY